MSANYRDPQLLLPNCNNLKLPGTGTSVGSGLTADRHSLYSMDFDGSNDYVDVGNVLNFERTDSFSISAWCYFNGTGTMSTFSKLENISSRCTAFSSVSFGNNYFITFFQIVFSFLNL